MQMFLSECLYYVNVANFELHMDQCLRISNHLSTNFISTYVLIIEIIPIMTFTIMSLTRTSAISSLTRTSTTSTVSSVSSLTRTSTVSSLTRPLSLVH